MILEADTHALRLSANSTRGCRDNVGHQIGEIRRALRGCLASDLIGSNRAFDDQPGVIDLIAEVLDSIAADVEGADKLSSASGSNRLLAGLDLWLSSNHAPLAEAESRGRARPLLEQLAQESGAGGTAADILEALPPSLVGLYWACLSRDERDSVIDERPDVFELCVRPNSDVSTVDVEEFREAIAFDASSTRLDLDIGVKAGFREYYAKTSNGIFAEVVMDTDGNYMLNIGAENSTGVGLQAGKEAQLGSASASAGIHRELGLVTTLKFSSRAEAMAAVSDVQSAAKRDASKWWNPLDRKDRTARVLGKLWDEHGVSHTFSVEIGGEGEVAAAAEVPESALTSALVSLSASLSGSLGSTSTRAGYLVVPRDGTAKVGLRVEEEVGGEASTEGGTRGPSKNGVTVAERRVRGFAGSTVVDVHVDIDGANAGGTVTHTGAVESGLESALEAGDPKAVAASWGDLQSVSTATVVTHEYAGDGSAASLTRFVRDARPLSTSNSEANVTVQTIRETSDATTVSVELGVKEAGIDGSARVSRSASKVTSSTLTPMGGRPIDQVDAVDAR